MNIKKTSILVLKTLLLAVIGIITTMIAAGILPEPEIITQASKNSSPDALITLFLMRLAMAAAFVYAISAARTGGWRLMLALYLASFGFAGVMTQSETMIFIKSFPMITPPEVLLLALNSLVSFLIFVPIAVLVMGRARENNSGAGEQVNFFIPRLLLSAGLYVAVYFFFGNFVAYKFEAVRNFYVDNQAASNIAVLIPLQFMRGLFWVMLGMPLLSLMPTLRQKIICGGIFYPVFIGFLLIVPNPLMPGPVRFGHFWEITSSMALFGCLVAWLMYGRLLNRKSATDAA